MSAQLLRVAYDREIFVRQARGGISRYYAELVRAFSDEPELGVEPSLLFERSSNVHLAAAVQHVAAPMPGLRPAPRGVPRLLNQGTALKDAFLRYRAGGSGAAGRGDFDWLHATYFRPMASDVARARRLAMTVYDMIPEQLGLDTTTGPHQGKLALARRADLVLAISQATADLLVERAPELADRVVVTPLAVDARAFAPSDGSDQTTLPGDLPFPYVLFVGTRGGYKRFDLALAAVQELRARGLDVGLAVAGPALSDAERAAITTAIPANRVVASTPDDTALARLYQRAVALALPSTMEGFGLPLLEAFAAGCPVVASDIPVFRETGGTAARSFTAGDSHALAHEIEQLLDPATADAARAAGLAIAAAHTWSRTARITAEAYRARTD
ncbi:MAG: glycosyltransferase family 1 protein [Candidatus Nanopelagicales bacterium]|nr:glycosyltransferase family 1 protein [Candidatus Nanopelagicales bacterium]